MRFSPLQGKWQHIWILERNTVNTVLVDSSLKFVSTAPTFGEETKMRKWIVAGCFLMAGIGLLLSCARSPSKPPPAYRMSIASINALTNGHIYFEEQRSQVYVTIVDPSGDGHTFCVEHDGLGKEKALNLLNAKQQELNKAK